MGDIKVCHSAFAHDKMQFVSPRSYKVFTRDLTSVVKHAEIKENTEPDQNGNEDISVSSIAFLHQVSEEPSITQGVVEEEGAPPPNGASKGESDAPEHEQIQEKKISSTKGHHGLTFSPVAAIHKIADEADDALTHMADKMWKFTHRIEEAITELSGRQPSIEEDPENNIHLFHHSNQKLIKMGLHIEEHDEGCRIARMIKGGVACRTDLREDDVIRKIDDISLTGKSIGEIITHFSHIDLTKAFCLTIRRKGSTDGEEVTFIDLDIYLTITISENNIDYEIEVTITTEQLKYQSTTNRKYIFQTPSKQSPVYMRVEGKDACMNIKVDENAVFRLELYKGGSNARSVCVIRNETSYQVIDKNNVNSQNDLLAAKAPSPNGSVVSSPGTKYFYWTSHPVTGDDIFESLNKKGHYITSTESNKLVLKPFKSLGKVKSEAQFKVIDVS